MKTLHFFALCLFLISSILVKTSAQSANITEGCLPLSVDFTAPTGHASHYWDFGDGASSTIQNPSNTFLNTGTYIVNFSETAAGAVVGTVTINVYATPTPSFIITNESGCSPLVSSFSDNTTLSNGISITGYNWIFSNGATATGNNVSYSFTTTGVYDVSFSITTNFASCDASFQLDDAITVSTPPVVSFTTNPNPAVSCTPPLDVTFQNFSSSSIPLTYSWDFGNGNTSTDENPSQETYSSNGSYQTILTVTDTNGCVRNSQLNISVGSPEASFIVDDTICINTIDTLFNTSPAGSYSWDVGAGSVTPIPISSNQEVLFSTPGFHDITLSILGACPDDTTITVFVEEMDSIFTSSPTFSCEAPMSVQFTPNSTTQGNYFWEFGNDSTSDLTAPINIYYNNDTTIYSINGQFFETTLTVTSTSGCTASFTNVDTLGEPNAYFLPSVVDGCLPVTVTYRDSSFSYSSITDWEWHFGDGTVVNSATNQDQTITYNTYGTFGTYLIITNANGCKDTSYIVPTLVGDNITPDFSVSPTDVCRGETIQFTDLTTDPLADSIDSWHYYTEESLMFSCFNEQNPSWEFNHVAGPQDVTLVVGFNGCFSQITKSNIVNIKGPIADFTYENECNTPFLVDFTSESQDITSLLWDFGDGNTSTATNPSHTYAVRGDYTVTLIATNSTTGCTDDTISKLIYIRNISAGFSAPTKLCESTPTDFDASTSVDVYEYCGMGYTWYFSDPGMRPIMTEDASKPISFGSTGNHEVTLIVSDINNCKDTATIDFKVYGVTSNFSFSDDTICLPDNVSFTESSFADTTIIGWNWDFGNGNVSTAQNPTSTITASTLNSQSYNIDTVEVTLITENIVGCLAEVTKYIMVYEPTSSITASDYYICSGESVDFTATDYTTYNSNLSYSWDFNDGNTSTDQNPSNTFNSGGTHNVVLTFTEIASGCTGTKNIVINVKEFPVANFTTLYDNDLYICPDENILITNTTNASGFILYNWDFGNGLTSTITDPGTIFTTNGTYNVQLIANIPLPYGCSDTTTRTFVVQAPYGNFTTSLGTDTICRLDSVLFNIFDTVSVDQYYWDFGDGTGVTSISPVYHQYTFVPPSGTTISKLILSNSDGSCPFTQSQEINIYEVLADFERNINDLDTALCIQPFPFDNTSLNATTYFWDFGDGQTSNSQNPGTHTYTQPGTYSVSLGVMDNEHFCTDTIIKDIIIFENPSISIIGDTICEGQTAFIYEENPNATYTYNWTSEPSYNINDNTLANIQDTPGSTTTYTLNAVDTNGCTNSEQAIAIVIPPLYIPNFDTTIVVGDSIFLPINLDPNIYTYTWTPEDGLSCTSCINPIVHPLDDVEYQLSIADNFNCFSAEGTYTVAVHPETFINLPTTFTPNGDGNNDIIYVEGWGIKELIEYKIFNRWGELIFETTDKETGWNGYYKGVLQNNDVYVVQVKATTWRNEEKTYEGHINLMR